MLELRPSCEHCNASLPPEAEAMICSFECTFCPHCTEHILKNICPNCGGGFTPRPIRPAQNHHGNNYLGAYPASTMLKHRPVDTQRHAMLVEKLAMVPPQKR